MTVALCLPASATFRCVLHEQTTTQMSLWRNSCYSCRCRYRRWQLEAAARQAEQAALAQRLRGLLEQQQAAEREAKQASACLLHDQRVCLRCRLLMWYASCCRR